MDGLKTRNTIENDNVIDSTIWGYLLCITPSLHIPLRFEFKKTSPMYTLGRRKIEGRFNHVELLQKEISLDHASISCEIQDGHVDVRIRDISTNGTFLNGRKLMKAQSRKLRHGDIVTFGKPPGENVAAFAFKLPFNLLSVCQELDKEFHLGKTLGEGTFGIVKKVMNRAKNVYAAKIMSLNRPERMQGAISSFTQEAEILEKVQHPNICTLFEVWKGGNGSIALILEYVNGGTLTRYVEKKDGLQVHETRDITYQICDAIAYLHAKNITHRDLKPDNILLTRENPPMVKVADLGVSKLTQGAAGMLTMCGTAAWGAPEVFHYDKRTAYNNLVDSWSLGVIIVFTLSNKEPFADKKRSASALKDLESIKCPDEVVSFIRRLLHNDPGHRLSITNALEHPWLKDYIPYHGVADTSVDNDV